MGWTSLLDIVAYPFAFWALQKTAEGIGAFRQALRARYIDTVQLADDISTNVTNSLPQIAELEAALSGTPCTLEKRIAADPRYYSFSVSGEITIKVFEKDAVQRYSHIDSELFKQVKQFYDLQAIIAATFLALQTDLFRDLEPGTRKLGVFQKQLEFLKQANETGKNCLPRLNQEITFIETSVLWAILFLNHKRFR